MSQIDFSKPIGHFKTSCYYHALLYEPILHSVIFQFVSFFIYIYIYNIGFLYILYEFFTLVERYAFYFVLSLFHYILTIVLLRGKILNSDYLEDLNDKLAVVTGGCKGIGSCISIALLKNGCKVVVIGRDNSASVELIKFASDSLKIDKNLIHFVEMDLDNFQSIKNGVAIISNKFKQIDYLINNAAIGVCTSKSSDSLSKHFNGDSVYSTNVFGHYILTEMLIPMLSKCGRVINMSSIVHFVYKPSLKISNISFNYGKTKLANIHHAIVLQRKFNAMNNDCLAFSCAPGFILTKLFSDMRLHINSITDIMKYALVSLFGKTGYQAAQVAIFLCVTPKNKLCGGSYYNNLEIGITSKYASDIKLQKKFYEEANAIYQKLISEDNKLVAN